MFTVSEANVTKQKFNGAKKKSIKIWDVNVYNTVISNLIETKNNSSYLAWSLDELIKPLVWILHKMSGYVKTFNIKYGDKDKNNKLISFGICD